MLEFGVSEAFTDTALAQGLAVLGFLASFFAPYAVLILLLSRLPWHREWRCLGGRSSLLSLQAHQDIRLPADLAARFIN